MPGYQDWQFTGGGFRAPAPTPNPMDQFMALFAGMYSQRQQMFMQARLAAADPANRIAAMNAAYEVKSQALAKIAEQETAAVQAASTSLKAVTDEATALIQQQTDMYANMSDQRNSDMVNWYGPAWKAELGVGGAQPSAMSDKLQRAWEGTDTSGSLAAEIQGIGSGLELYFRDDGDPPKYTGVNYEALDTAVRAKLKPFRQLLEQGGVFHGPRDQALREKIARELKPAYDALEGVLLQTHSWDPDEREKIQNKMQSLRGDMFNVIALPTEQKPKRGGGASAYGSLKDALSLIESNDDPSATRLEVNKFIDYLPGDDETMISAAASLTPQDFATAYELNPEAAVNATSFGKYQVMGFNFLGSEHGYPSAEAFKQEFDANPEKASQQILSAFWASASGEKAKKAGMKIMTEGTPESFEEFAAAYNGPAWKSTNPEYASKLQRAYAPPAGTVEGIPAPPPRVTPEEMGISREGVAARLSQVQSNQQELTNLLGTALQATTHLGPTERQIIGSYDTTLKEIEKRYDDPKFGKLGDPIPSPWTQRQERKKESQMERAEQDVKGLAAEMAEGEERFKASAKELTGTPTETEVELTHNVFKASDREEREKAKQDLYNFRNRSGLVQD